MYGDGNLLAVDMIT